MKKRQMNQVKKAMSLLWLVFLLAACQEKDKGQAKLVNGSMDEPIENMQTQQKEETPQETEIKLDDESQKLDENLAKEGDTKQEEEKEAGENDPALGNAEPALMPELKPPATEHDLAIPSIVDDPQDASYGSPMAGDKYSNESKDWYFKRNKEFIPPGAQTDFDIRPLGGYYLGDIEEKVIYLTFDEGYENGLTPTILDVLQDKGVEAAFFVTKPYIVENPDLIIRMKEEGHVVANHSVTHKNFPTLSDEKIAWELAETNQACFELTGYELDPFFRPPAGVYSARTLDETKKAGYLSVFWSLAFLDWDVTKQPGAEKSYENTVNYVHNGCIALLHAVSESNTQALPRIIDKLLANGFRFASLHELPLLGT